MKCKTMSRFELQNIIIRRILNIQNTDLLDKLNQILQEMEDKEVSPLSEYEKNRHFKRDRSGE